MRQYVEAFSNVTAPTVPKCRPRVLRKPGASASLMNVASHSLAPSVLATIVEEALEPIITSSSTSPEPSSTSQAATSESPEELSPPPAQQAAVRPDPGPLPVIPQVLDDAVKAPIVAFVPNLVQAPHPVAASQPVGQADTGNSYINQMLSIHNLYRSSHNAKPLTWNNNLVDYLKPFASTCVFKHSGGPHGENIAMGTVLSGTDAVAMWYAEQSLYSSPGFSAATGHYTQVVWKSTTDLGCITQTCQNGLYTMCNYSPAGNVESPGEFESNVQRLIAGAPTGTAWA